MEANSSPIRGDWHAGQWGLAALLIGGLVVFLFPIMIMSMFGAMVGANTNDYLKSSDLDLGVIATYLSVGGLVALSLFALLSGAIGLLRGMSRSQPLGLALGGAIVALVAVVLSIVLFVIALRCIEWTRDFQKERFDPNRQWKLQPMGHPR